MRLVFLLLCLLLTAQKREELQAYGVSAQLSPFLAEELKEYALTDTNPNTAPVLVKPVTYAYITSAVSSSILRLSADYPELKRFCIVNASNNTVQILAPSGFQINTAPSYSLPTNRFLCLIRLSTTYRYYDYGAADASDAATGNSLANWLEDTNRNFTQGSNAANIVFFVPNTGIRFSNSNPFIRVDTSNLVFQTSTIDRWRFTSTGNLESLAGDLIISSTNKIRSLGDLNLNAASGSTIKQQVNDTTVLEVGASQISANQNIVLPAGKNVTFTGDAIIRSGATNNFFLQRGTAPFLTFNGSTIEFSSPLFASSLSYSSNLILSSGASNALILRRGSSNQLILDGSSASFYVAVRANRFTTLLSSSDLVIDAPSGRKVSLRVNDSAVLEVSASAINFYAPVAFSTITAPPSTNLTLNAPTGQEIRFQINNNTRFSLFNDYLSLRVPYVLPFMNDVNDASFDTPVGFPTSANSKFTTSLLLPTMNFWNSVTVSNCNNGNFQTVTDGKGVIFTSDSYESISTATRNAIKNYVMSNANRRNAIINRFLPYGGRLFSRVLVSNSGSECHIFFVLYFDLNSTTTNRIFGTWEVEVITGLTGSLGRVVPMLCFYNSTPDTKDVYYGTMSHNNSTSDYTFARSSHPLSSDQIFCRYFGASQGSYNAPVVLNRLRAILRYADNQDINLPFIIDFDYVSSTPHWRVAPNHLVLLFTH